jgi:hypothetical protein
MEARAPSKKRFNSIENTEPFPHTLTAPFLHKLLIDTAPLPHKVISGPVPLLTVEANLTQTTPREAQELNTWYANGTRGTRTTFDT